jgi:hypothetical protein
MSDPSLPGTMLPSSAGAEESGVEVEASDTGKPSPPPFEPPHAAMTANASRPIDPAVDRNLIAIFYPNGD